VLTGPAQAPASAASVAMAQHEWRRDPGMKLCRIYSAPHGRASTA
jgi:hypothetical protein